MKIIECNNLEYEQIKNGKQQYKVFNTEYSFDFLEKCKLKNKETKEIINIQITSFNKYNDLKSMLKVINIEKFGNFKNYDELYQYLDKNYNITKEFVVCRLKNLEEANIEIKDKVLLKLINEQTLEKLNLGLSGCHVYTVKTNENKKAILKIQTISGNDKLKEEYDVLKFLNNKIKVAKTYYYNYEDNYEYLLRECLEGEPLYKFKNFGYKLGEELKKIHSLISCKNQFNKFSTENLLDNALKNIDAVYQVRSEKFINYTKEELIDFLKINKPENDSLIHGDFSLTNILVDGDEYSYIDLGNVSISTKYFDIYVLRKSLIINKLENELPEFLKGYGIEEIEEVYMDWMSLIESSYN